MTDLEAALFAAHRGNIERYRRILRTQLTHLERDFVLRRLSEERAALQALRVRTGRGQAGAMPPPRSAPASGTLAAG